MHIDIREVPKHLRKDPKDLLSKPLGFGQVFCDRMFKATWNGAQGWHDAAIGPYEPLVLDPAATVFHYAQEIFEGLKAYRTVDGGVALFRPEANCERFNQSAKRLVMPTVPLEDQLEVMTTLVSLLRDWVPDQEGYSLYLRPAMIGTTAVLGVKPALDYLYYIICSPVAGYFPTGFEPVRVNTSITYSRAAEGGTGMAKCGGNYAGSMAALKEAKDQGFSQNIWLDAKEHRYVEEMGGMNIMFVYGDTIRTCPLTGTILPGITRDSIGRLAPDLGYRFEEAHLDITEVCADIDRGKVTEVFACGTAAVVTAISHISHLGAPHQVGDGTPGEVTHHLYRTLVDIQTGRAKDPYGWTRKVV